MSFLMAQMKENNKEYEEIALTKEALEWILESGQFASWLEECIKDAKQFVHENSAH